MSFLRSNALERFLLLFAISITICSGFKGDLEARDFPTFEQASSLSIRKDPAPEDLLYLRSSMPELYTPELLNARLSQRNLELRAELVRRVLSRTQLRQQIQSMSAEMEHWKSFGRELRNSHRLRPDAKQDLETTCKDVPRKASFMAARDREKEMLMNDVRDLRRNHQPDEAELLRNKINEWYAAFQQHWANMEDFVARTKGGTEMSKEGTGPSKGGRKRMRGSAARRYQAGNQPPEKGTSGHENN